jgi:hypothetical protein
MVFAPMARFFEIKKNAPLRWFAKTGACFAKNQSARNSFELRISFDWLIVLSWKKARPGLRRRACGEFGIPMCNSTGGMHRSLARRLEAV